MNMDVQRDANGFVVLDREACLERLAQRSVASLAITDGALPMVLPALYMLHGEDILITAAETGVLGRRLPNSVISLCVYDLDDRLSTGWSVTVTGQAEQLTTLDALERTADLRRWGSSETGQLVVRIGTERISGRQIS